MEDFDLNWTIYEKIYIHELMNIEKMARWFIVNAYENEKQLSDLENFEKIMGHV